MNWDNLIDEVAARQENRPVRTRSVGMPMLTKAEFRIAMFARQQAIKDVVIELKRKLKAAMEAHNENSTV